MMFGSMQSHQHQKGSATQKDVIRLIINVEAQTAFNPGYPLTKSAQSIIAAG